MADQRSADEASERPHAVPAAGDIPNEKEAAEVFEHGVDRPLKEQRPLYDEHGNDIRQFTGEPVETEEGVVLPQQQVVGSQRVVGGGEFAQEPPRGADDPGAGDDTGDQAAEPTER